MRRTSIILGILVLLPLVLLPTTAFAATKWVVTHKVDYYECGSALNCRFAFSEETVQEVDSRARLVSIDQDVKECTAYPCLRVVETWYNWAVCTNICPVSEPNDPVPLTTVPEELKAQ